MPRHSIALLNTSGEKLAFITKDHALALIAKGVAVQVSERPPEIQYVRPFCGRLEQPATVWDALRPSPSQLPGPNVVRNYAFGTAGPYLRDVVESWGGIRHDNTAPTDYFEEPGDSGRAVLYLPGTVCRICDALYDRCPHVRRRKKGH